jgi:hypothetical protein
VFLSHLFRIFIAVVFWAASVAAFSAVSKDPLSVDLPDVPMMSGMSWYLLGERMALNGVPIRIKQFSYEGKLEEVAKHFRDQFKTMGHGKLGENQLGVQSVISYQLSGYYYSVQFHQEGARVVGKATVTPSPLEFRTSFKTQLPLPPRSKVISKVDSLDAGRRAETLSVDSRMDVGYIANYYLEQFQADGWQPFSRSGDMDTAAVLSFQRGGELIQLTIKGLQVSNSKRSQFLINWLK